MKKIYNSLVSFTLPVLSIVSLLTIFFTSCRTTNSSERFEEGLSQKTLVEIDGILLDWHKAAMEAEGDKETTLRTKLEEIANKYKNPFLKLIKEKKLSKYQPIMYGVLGFSGDCEISSVLIEGLRSDNQAIRANSALSLSQLSLCSNIPIKNLIDCITYEPDNTVRCNCAFALFRLINPSQVSADIEEFLLRYIDDSYPPVKNEIIRAVGKLKLKKATGYLLNTGLNESLYTLRLNSAIALANIEDTSIIPDLIEKLCDKSFIGKREVVYVLEKLTNKDFGLNYEEWINWYKNQVKSKIKKSK